MADQDAKIAQFASITGVPAHQARPHLAASNWDLEMAIAEFYASQEQDDSADDEEEDADYPDSSNLSPDPTFRGGGRRLGEGTSTSQPIPVVASSSKSSESKKNSAPRKKFATLGDFGGDSPGQDDEEPDSDKKRDLFAGGEKSGLAVQDPSQGDLKKKILEKAMKRSKPIEKEADQPQASHFTGTARTLGGEDIPSRTIEPPSIAQGPPRAQRVDRVLHFWNDGFSIDDGELYRSDDPRNAEILNGIRQGRAPLSIMGVTPGQEVDVEIKQHQENYVQPKKKFVPFSGQGNRLGSPTPGELSMPGSFATGTAPRTPSPVRSANPSAEVDETQPVIQLRVNLGTGSRLPVRFNTSHTIGDVYAFVRRADSSDRQFVLQTTFPTKDLNDQSQTLGDTPEFKRGGVVVQKYI